MHEIFVFEPKWLTKLNFLIGGGGYRLKIMGRHSLNGGTYAIGVFCESAQVMGFPLAIWDAHPSTLSFLKELTKMTAEGLKKVQALQPKMTIDCIVNIMQSMSRNGNLEMSAKLDLFLNYVPKAQFVLRFVKTALAIEEGQIEMNKKEDVVKFINALFGL